MRGIALIGLLALGGCASTTVVPAEVQPPDNRLLVPSAQLKLPPPQSRADPEVWTAYAQCRLSHAEEADLRRGLIAYVTALRGSR